MDNLQYMGVIIAECEKCGEITTIFSREKTDRVYCNDCGNRINLTTTAPVSVRATCKCGKQTRAVTNKSDKKMFEFKCKCGCPVPLEFNSKKNRFQNI